MSNKYKVTNCTLVEETIKVETDKGLDLYVVYDHESKRIIRIDFLKRHMSSHPDGWWKEGEEAEISVGGFKCFVKRKDDGSVEFIEK